jgi:hypothetical protein
MTYIDPNKPVAPAPAPVQAVPVEPEKKSYLDSFYSLFKSSTPAPAPAAPATVGGKKGGKRKSTKKSKGGKAKTSKRSKK